MQKSYHPNHIHQFCEDNWYLFESYSQRKEGTPDHKLTFIRIKLIDKFTGIYPQHKGDQNIWKALYNCYEEYHTDFGGFNI